MNVSGECVCVDVFVVCQIMCPVATIFVEYVPIAERDIDESDHDYNKRLSAKCDDDMWQTKCALSIFENRGKESIIEVTGHSFISKYVRM